MGDIGGVIGGYFAGESAKDAARTQADAIIEAQRMTREAADEARAEILDRFAPALAEYRAGIYDAQDQIAAGTADIMNILQQTTSNADMMIAQTGADAERALLGSAASAQGVSWPDFNQQYQAIQAQPPTARRAMTNQIRTQIERDRAIKARETERQAAAEAEAEATAQPMRTVKIGGIGGTSFQVPSDSPIARPITPDQTTQSGRVGAQVGGQGTTLAQRTMRPEDIPGSLEQRRTTMPTGQGQILGERAQVQGQAPVSTPAAAVPEVGFGAAMGHLQQGYGTAQSALDASQAQARADVTGQTSQALQQLAETREAGLGRYQPYSEAGQAAVAREAALSGAYGPEAQQEAINAFIESPGQRYLRERQEQSLLRNQAAIGGLGGGNVRTALQEQAMGIAATQQQQYLENLRSLATRGQEIAGAESGLIASTGMMGAQMTQGAGNTLAQLSQQYGISSANLAQMSSAQMAQLAQETGMQLADIRRAVGAARAGLQTELGAGLAGAAGAGAADLARLTEAGASTGMTSEQNLATILANLATGAGSSIAGLQMQAGSALAAGQYLQGQAWGQALQGLGQSAANVDWNSIFNRGNTDYSGQSTNANVTDMSHLQ